MLVQGWPKPCRISCASSACADLMRSQASPKGPMRKDGTGSAPGLGNKLNGVQGKTNWAWLNTDLETKSRKKRALFGQPAIRDKSLQRMPGLSSHRARDAAWLTVTVRTVLCHLLV